MSRVGDDNASCKSTGMALVVLCSLARATLNGFKKVSIQHACSVRLSTNGRLFDGRGVKSLVQPVSPHAPIGVSAAIAAATDSTIVPRAKLFDQFSLKDRVGIVTGANRGLGLEIALALCEAGARAIYCMDLPQDPSEDWRNTQAYVKRLNNGSRLEYMRADVTDQKGIWAKAKEIGDREKRMDVCVAAAGILRGDEDCLDTPGDRFQEVHDVNVKGVLYTAQAVGKQMVRFGNLGSIILIASVSGHVTNEKHPWISYNSSKSAVLQMTRSLACELAPQIRVNSISPGHFYTKMTANFLDANPGVLEFWQSRIPMGRIATPDELRGAIAWLASDASSFCTGSDILITGGYHAW